MDTYDGKLYGIGDPPSIFDGGYMLWYRNDWAANCGFTDKPKTIDDVLKMAYAFARNDPNKRYNMNKFYGPQTDTMNAKWGALMQKRDEVFTKIIMGSSMSEFDKWLDYWKTQGGEDITKEVNDWYVKQSK